MVYPTFERNHGEAFRVSSIGNRRPGENAKGIPVKLSTDESICLPIIEALSPKGIVTVCILIVLAVRSEKYKILYSPWWSQFINDATIDTRGNWRY